MSDTTHTNYTFTVKEYDGGTPWIALEPRDEQPAAFKNGLLGFDLPKGTSYNKAKEVASFLNENLGDLSYTSI